MKPFLLLEPLPWLPKTALMVLACSLVLHANAKTYRNHRKDRPHEIADRYSEAWWRETKLMIERGYAHFCAVHGIDPRNRNWDSKLRRERCSN